MVKLWESSPASLSFFCRHRFIGWKCTGAYGTTRRWMIPEVFLKIPIGSMYGIYANIWGILMVNVTIYSIHGSYGNIQWPFQEPIDWKYRFHIFLAYF